MGFPSSGFMESRYRNSIRDVELLLEKKHSNHYLIFNLSGRRYDYSIFHDRVIDYGFPDHRAPSFPQLLSLIYMAYMWLSEKNENVIAVHCLAGKGRTGVFICCLMLFFESINSEFLSPYQSSKRVSKYFNDKRGEGIDYHNQFRYVYYFALYLSYYKPYYNTFNSLLSPEPSEVFLKEIIIMNPFVFMGGSSSNVHITINVHNSCDQNLLVDNSVWNETSTIITNLTNNTVVNMNNSAVNSAVNNNNSNNLYSSTNSVSSSASNFSSNSTSSSSKNDNYVMNYKCNISVNGDFSISFYNTNTEEEVWWLDLNTLFIDEMPFDCDGRLEYTINEIDISKRYKNKIRKDDYYSFKIILIYQIKEHRVNIPIPEIDLEPDISKEANPEYYSIKPINPNRNCIIRQIGNSRFNNGNNNYFDGTETKYFDPTISAPHLTTNLHFPPINNNGNGNNGNGNGRERGDSSARTTGRKNRINYLTSSLKLDTNAYNDDDVDYENDNDNDEDDCGCLVMKRNLGMHGLLHNSSMKHIHSDNHHCHHSNRPDSLEFNDKYADLDESYNNGYGYCDGSCCKRETKSGEEKKEEGKDGGFGIDVTVDDDDDDEDEDIDVDDVDDIYNDEGSILSNNENSNNKANGFGTNSSVPKRLPKLKRNRNITNFYDFKNERLERRSSSLSSPSIFNSNDSSASNINGNNGNNNRYNHHKRQSFYRRSIPQLRDDIPLTPSSTPCTPGSVKIQPHPYIMGYLSYKSKYQMNRFFCIIRNRRDNNRIYCSNENESYEPVLYLYPNTQSGEKKYVILLLHYEMPYPVISKENESSAKGFILNVKNEFKSMESIHSYVFQCENQNILMNWIKAIRECQGYYVSEYCVKDKIENINQLIEDEYKLKNFLKEFYYIYNPQKILKINEIINEYRMKEGNLKMLISDICEIYDLTEDELLESDLAYHRSFIEGNAKGMDTSLIYYNNEVYNGELDIEEMENEVNYMKMEEDLSIEFLHVLSLIMDNCPSSVYVNFVTIMFSYFYPQYLSLVSLKFCEYIHVKYLQV